MPAASPPLDATVLREDAASASRMANALESQSLPEHKAATRLRLRATALRLAAVIADDAKLARLIIWNEDHCCCRGLAICASCVEDSTRFRAALLSAAQEGQ